MHQSQPLDFELRNELPLAPDNKLFFSCKEEDQPHAKLNERLIFNHSRVEVRNISAFIESHQFCHIRLRMLDYKAFYN
jgi:hypothetical protein